MGDYRRENKDGHRFLFVFYFQYNCKNLECITLFLLRCVKLLLWIMFVNMTTIVDFYKSDLKISTAEKPVYK